MQFGQQAKMKEAVLLWYNAENDEEKMDACSLMEQCKGDDVECLLMLSQWWNELGDEEQAIECCREGADVWSDLKCITFLVHHFKRKGSEGEESYAKYLQQGAILKDPTLICEFAHYLQFKANLIDFKSGEDDDLRIWTEKVRYLSFLGL